MFLFELNSLTHSITHGVFLVGSPVFALLNGVVLLDPSVELISSSLSLWEASLFLLCILDFPFSKHTLYLI